MSNYMNIDGNFKAPVGTFCFVYFGASCGLSCNALLYFGLKIVSCFHFKVKYIVNFYVCCGKCKDESILKVHILWEYMILLA